MTRFVRFLRPTFDRRRFRLVLAGLLVCGVVAGAVAGAAEPVRKVFDIPADLAERSLRQFSAQSGVQVIFPTAVVRDVRTRAVKGEFTSREALERMVATTALKVLYDEKTRALTIVRSAETPPVERPRAPGSLRQ